MPVCPECGIDVPVEGLCPECRAGKKSGRGKGGGSFVVFLLIGGILLFGAAFFIGRSLGV